MLADKVATMGLNHDGTGKQAESGEHAAQDPSHGGLPRSRRAREHEVPRGWLAGQALTLAHARDLKLGGDRTDLVFDRLEPDEAVKLGQRTVQRGRLRVAAEPRGELGESVLSVGGADGDELGRIRIAPVAHDPHIASLRGLLDETADEPPVAEVIHDSAASNDRHSAGRASGWSTSPRRSTHDSAICSNSAGL